jgi:hypothetical protein
MPVGSSGRIVIEVDPEFKSVLHTTLREQGISLKDWFVAQATEHVRTSMGQISLFETTDEEAGGPS